MKVDIYKPEKRYKILYVDPPWDYKCGNRLGSAKNHYPTMKFSELAALPVPELAERDAALFMWATYPKIEEALRLIPAWGFEYKTIAFQWIKLNPTTNLNEYRIMTAGEILKKSCVLGLGYWTRGNTECCLLATKGHPKRESAGISQLIFSPRGRHSEKPAEVREKIRKLVGGGAAIELFARQTAEGWDCWGNEV